MEDKPRLLVLYASQTGNAMDAAEHVGREAERRACRAVVLSMDDYNVSFLPHEGTVIFIVSTTGQGDTPDSMKVFWRFLLQRNLNCQWLEEVHYAVFGLGDSSYQKYNFVAKKLDKRLADLGARPIIERGLGDDQHPSGYEGALDPWLSSLWNMIKQIPIFSINFQVLNPDLKTVDSPKYQIIYHNIDMMQPHFSTSSDLKLIESQIVKARSMSLGILHRNDNRPRCFLQMTKNQLLTKLGSGRDVRHFEFEALSSVIDYQVGDVLEVLPSQNPAAVDAFIKRCNLNPESYITVQPRGVGRPNLENPIKLRTFVELTMDVASASPRRYFFEVMSFFSTAEHERERLQYFSSPEGRDDLYRYNQKERRTVLEVLEDFPSVQLPFERLVQLVPPLKTRHSQSPLHLQLIQIRCT